MRFCMDHWDRLRAAIDTRGLSALIAADGEQAAKNLVSEANGGPSIDNFDPLMGAHNAILNNVMGIVGLAVMMPNDDGSDRCPLCFLNAEHEQHCVDPTCRLDRVNGYDDWIDRAADDMAEAWKAMRP